MSKLEAIFAFFMFLNEEHMMQFIFIEKLEKVIVLL